MSRTARTVSPPAACVITRSPMVDCPSSVAACEPPRSAGATSRTALRKESPPVPSEPARPAAEAARLSFASPRMSLGSMSRMTLACPVGSPTRASRPPTLPGSMTALLETLPGSMTALLERNAPASMSEAARGMSCSATLSPATETSRAPARLAVFRAIASPTVNVLLIRWSIPSDISLPASPLRSAATSSSVSLKPRSAAAGFDWSWRRNAASLIARWMTFSKFLLDTWCSFHRFLR